MAILPEVNWFNTKPSACLYTYISQWVGRSRHGYPVHSSSIHPLIIQTDRQSSSMTSSQATRQSFMCDCVMFWWNDGPYSVVSLYPVVCRRVCRNLRVVVALPAVSDVVQCTEWRELVNCMNVYCHLSWDRKQLVAVAMHHVQGELCMDYNTR